MSEYSQNDLPIAVTIGEPAGIGPDVILQSWVQQKQSGTGIKLKPFYVLGDAEMLQQRAQLLDIGAPVKVVSPGEAAETFDKALPVVPLKNKLTAKAGIAKTQDATGIIEAIETAVEHIKTGFCRAMVTAPISKKSLYVAGFSHPGHTEFLADLATGWPGNNHQDFQPVMMLAGPRLRAVPVTIHIPLVEVANRLSIDKIIEVAGITANDLEHRFKISNPRLAISGLNPHAGEEGAMGGEDEAIIVPAIAALKSMGIDAVGPLPADTMFHERARATYDAAICMYHDQALIPAKALDFDQTVNVTLGLPFVRTSPDHGTAFDIAGSGKSNPSSMIAALQLADTMSAQHD